MLARMKLYGTLTSPFVRRVRVVAAELSLPFTLVDAFTDEGQAALRQASPIWKVPALELDGKLLWDSGHIVDHLLERHGHGPLRVESPEERIDGRNLRVAIDEALLALVRFFYLRRDGVDVEQPAYLQKEKARVASILSFVEAQLKGSSFADDGGFGLSELTLVTALDWMAFRQTWDASASPAFMRFLEAHETRTSLVETKPSAA